MRPTAYINARQRNWARRHGIEWDAKGYVETVDMNLFRHLSEGAHTDFHQGSGDELKSKRVSRKPNMLALHSSSALVVNIFDYWRHIGDVTRLLRVLKPGLTEPVVEDVQFEAKLPIDWPDRLAASPPNLDVLVRHHAPTLEGRPEILAIESKFREPYDQDQGSFKDRYFTPRNDAMWEGIGPLRELAKTMQTTTVYRHLKASQLIKHILGVRAYANGRRWELLYLWYEVSGVEAVRHAQEIAHFADVVSAAGLNFASATYHDLLYGLESQHRTAHKEYLDYLMERYF